MSAFDPKRTLRVMLDVGESKRQRLPQRNPYLSTEKWHLLGADVLRRDISAVISRSIELKPSGGSIQEASGARTRVHALGADRLSAATGRSITYESISPKAYEQEKAAQGWPRSSIDE